MPPPETTLAPALSDRTGIGQILIRQIGGRFVLCHRDDEERRDLNSSDDPEDALRISRFDDAGNYRPLKTAPNLRHGWRLELNGDGELQRALEYFYPGRLAAIVAWKQRRLTTTSLRDTLGRQSGMYRVAANISDEQIDDVVGSVCNSRGGCLRAILWRRDSSGAIPSTKLPPEKFDAGHSQTGGNESTIPLLCQEACTVLVNACRIAVKGTGNG